MRIKDILIDLIHKKNCENNQNDVYDKIPENRVSDKKSKIIGFDTKVKAHPN